MKKTENKKCLIVNLFGGPGTGKSTNAAALFYRLKMMGINCELVTEFAKDITWEKNRKALACQPYVFGKQCYRIERCVDQVDVIITDSPLPLSILYNKDGNIEPYFSKMVVKKFNSYKNMNYLLESKHLYSNIGRNETAEEAQSINEELFQLLNKFKIDYVSIPVNKDTVDILVEDVAGQLGRLCINE